MSNDLTQQGLGLIGIQGISGPTINVTQIIGKSYQYNDLLDQLNTQQKLFDRTPDAETQERLEISTKINDLTDQIEQLKQDVLKLAEAFQNIEVNTDRLKRAKEYFDNGEIGEARIVLETELEQMQSEQKHLLREREYYESETLPKLQNNSEEFYLLALSIQADYTNPNRFEDVCQYFKSSIESYPTKINVFDYSRFLQEHKQFVEAELYYTFYLERFKNEITGNEYAATLNNLAVLHKDQHRYEEALAKYEEALQIYQQLAEKNPQIYLPDVAVILNNLAILHKNQNRYGKALEEYEEALQICRQLTKSSPDLYLPNIAMILNNLANLHKEQNRYNKILKKYEYEIALEEYEEALQIRRQLAEKNPQVYLPDVATTLNNLALLHKDQNRYEKALEEYEEALQICRQLAERNSNTYLPNIAMILNNLAILHKDQNRYIEALKEYKEALYIYRQLTKINPEVYQIDIAQTTYNLAVLHQNNLIDKEKSIEYAIEVVSILRPIANRVPYIQKYLASTLNLLDGFDLDLEKVDKLVAEKHSEEM